MAAAAVSASTIDLKAQATYPIRLGNSVSKASDAPNFTSIRYNHKPSLKQSDSVTASIRAGKEDGKSTLSIDAEEGLYTFAGRCTQDEDSFVLVVRGRGNDKQLFLERMSSRHGFNLTSTPEEKDSEKLARRFPPLQEDAGEDDLFGDEEEDMPPDAENPFDFRHFLKTVLEKSESTNANIDAARHNAATPPAPPRVTSIAPAASKVTKRPEAKTSIFKKRKAPAADKNNPKRVKAGQEPPAPPAAAEPSSKPRTKPEVPKINLDRKASIARQPSLDDGELILENETPISEKAPKHNAMSLALNGQLGNGPISLRSAANSPAGSHVASPVAEEEYVFEFDDEPVEEVEEDDDADVEDLELPSPQVQHQHRPSLTGGGDDDDDLDKQLALAMMEEDDGGQGQGQESEEESEEE